MTVSVSIKYGELEEKFTGDADEVWISVNRFFSRAFPALDTIKDVVLTIDLKDIINASKGIVAITEEGPTVLISTKRLTDAECLLLRLLSEWIGERLGATESHWLSKDEIQEWLGKSSKITGTRLGELCRKGLAKRNERGDYGLTTLGLKWFLDGGVDKIRSKAK